MDLGLVILHAHAKDGDWTLSFDWCLLNLQELGVQQWIHQCLKHQAWMLKFMSQHCKMNTQHKQKFNVTIKIQWALHDCDIETFLMRYLQKILSIKLKTPFWFTKPTFKVKKTNFVQKQIGSHHVSRMGGKLDDVINGAMW